MSERTNVNCAAHARNLKLRFTMPLWRAATPSLAIRWLPGINTREELPMTSCQAQSDSRPCSMDGLCCWLCRYEAHPYPRWHDLRDCIPGTNTCVNAERPDPVEKEKTSTDRILVAGCGTGRFALQMAKHRPGAEFVLLDQVRLRFLTRASCPAGSVSEKLLVYCAPWILRVAVVCRLASVCSAQAGRVV